MKLEPASPGLMALIAGMIHRGTGRPCPWPSASARALIWRAGRDGRVRRNVSRGTKRKPGRGHGALGPRRDWSPRECAVLRLCEGMNAGDVGAILGRSAGSVTVKRHRLRKGLT